MTTSLQPGQKDFDQMMQILTGYFVTQVAGALATYSIADHLAKGPATADEIATWGGVDPQAAFRLLRAWASLGRRCSVHSRNARTYIPFRRRCCLSDRYFKSKIGR
jgi:hypothetical protein